mgnify:CR=1 FL=1
MSRYIVSNVVYGWDNPLQIFFAQRYEGEDCIDDIEAETVAELDAYCQQANILTPFEIIEKLQEDYKNREAQSPLQQLIVGWIKQDYTS